MLNKEKHEFVMIQILKDIYTNVSIAPLLGFKGGTAAYLFYRLPRFSVDLDFDFLGETEAERETVFTEMKKILEQYGVLKDEQRKFMTIFFLLSYGVGDHGIKIEVNLRPTGARYHLKNYLGIPMLVVAQESMFAGKLIALTKRKVFAPRDLYDTHFFLKNGWGVDERVLTSYGVDSAERYLRLCADFVGSLAQENLLAGLGELIDEKQKIWVREKLRDETAFLLRAYAKSLARTKETKSDLDSA